MNEPDDEAIAVIRRQYESVGAGAPGPDLRGLMSRAVRRRRRRRAVVGASVVAVVAGAAVVVPMLGGDGEGRAVDPPAADVPPAAASYDGPLQARGRYGAAAAVLDCRAVDGSSETQVPYAEGATSDTPEQALETATSEGLFLFGPLDDLRLAAAEPTRVLLTFAATGTTTMALIFHDGPATEGAGGPGWYLESSARCDYSQFPPAVAADQGYLLWSDPAGRPVPVDRVYSGPGPEHCDWQDTTFLRLDDRRSYVRDPGPDLTDYVAADYIAAMPLPDDAVDTGWERDGQHLWRAPGGRVVYVGTVASVEAWPRFDSGCD